MSSLFNWAIDPEVKLAEHNPVRDVKRINTGSDGHYTWTEDEVRASLNPQ